MAIYEYQCGSCQHQFETLVLTGESEPVTCQRCHSNLLRRLVSICSFKMSSTPYYRGPESNPFENLTLDNVRTETGEKVKVNSLSEMRTAEKRYNFVHVLSNSFTADGIDIPPTNEPWAGDITHDYTWKFCKDPIKQQDKVGVEVGIAASAKDTLAGR